MIIQRCKTAGTYIYPMKHCKLPYNVLIIRQFFNSIAAPITVQICISDFNFEKYMFINKYIQLRRIRSRVAFLYEKIPKKYNHNYNAACIIANIYIYIYIYKVKEHQSLLYIVHSIQQILGTPPQNL
jgi:hypothetical protein